MIESNINKGGSVTLDKATVNDINSGVTDKYIESANMVSSKYLTQDGTKISASTSGSNTYTAAISPSISSYSNGQRWYIKFGNGSTGSSTLNLNSLGALKIFVNPTTQAGSGDLVTSQIYVLAYDSTLDSGAGGFLIVGNNNSITPIALVDASTMDITGIKHTLSTSSASRTFTISYTGDSIVIEVTLNAASSTFTFPATALCVSEGTSSGNNTLSLSGSSGDKYILSIQKVGTKYYVVSKNFTR
jgi:hypothetical protein